MISSKKNLESGSYWCGIQLFAYCDFCMFLSSADVFQNLLFRKKYFKNTYDPGQARRFVLNKTQHFSCAELSIYHFVNFTPIRKIGKKICHLCQMWNFKSSIPTLVLFNLSTSLAFYHDRKIRPAYSPFVITQQASWWQSVILPLMMDSFIHIPRTNPWEDKKTNNHAS